MLCRWQIVSIAARFLSGLNRQVVDHVSSPCLLPGRYTAEEYIEKGDSCMKEARLDEAFRYYRMASRLRPKWSLPCKRMGMALGIMGFYADAVESLGGATRADSRDPEAWMLRGFCLVRMYRFEDALACFNSAILLNRSDPSALLWRDLALDAASRHEADPLVPSNAPC